MLIATKYLLIALYVASTCLGPIALAGNVWPKISGNIASQECSDADHLAKTMFNSLSPRLYAPVIIPDGMHSKIVLGASSLDISGGEALEEDKEQFEKVHQPGDHSVRSIYWSAHTENGVRIVVKETSAGWRGDVYSLYLIGADVTQIDFLKDVKNNFSNPKYAALFSGAWRPPLIFRTKSSKKTWFIDVNDPSQILADWNIYQGTLSGFQLSCTVKFRPEITKAENLLPQSVSRLSHLLDETIGPGNDEGTLQPTARLRLNVQHIWANAALRPWALSESDIYNSRDEVDAGLLAWSQGGPTYRRVYKEILRSYPIAESSLGKYYQKQFLLSEKKARRLAKWVLDIAFRSNYAFSNGGDYFRYDNVNTNPWKDK